MVVTLQMGLDILVYGDLPFSVLLQVYSSMQKSHKSRHTEADPARIETNWPLLVISDRHILVNFFVEEDYSHSGLQFTMLEA